MTEAAQAKAKLVIGVLVRVIAAVSVIPSGFLLLFVLGLSAAAPNAGAWTDTMFYAIVVLVLAFAAWVWWASFRPGPTRTFLYYVAGLGIVFQVMYPGVWIALWQIIKGNLTR